MPQFTFAATPDPGAAASDAAKMAYYRKNSNTYIQMQCVLNGVQTPLEVCKRTDNDGGVTEHYFSNEEHMRYYFHKIYGTEVNADLDTILEKACETPNADVLLKHGEPLRVVWQYPTYAALVLECYSTAQQMEERITQDAQQEAAIQAHTVAAIRARTSASLAPTTTTFVDPGMQHHNAMQSVNNSQMLAANQQMGFAPTEVVDGVPNYNASRGDVASAFRN
jgi:hypothetical protein